MLNPIISTPYPRPSLKTYTLVASSVAIIIVFILLVFQPFNTSNFKHPNKTFILAGYGVVVFVVLLAYYLFSLFVLNKSREKRWTVVLEVFDIFLSVVLSILGCYLYAKWVLGFNFSWADMGFFLISAASVALLPVLIYLSFIYFQWKDVVRSTLTTPTNSYETERTITLTGNNKGDSIQTSLDHILYLKAQDNYVILHLEQADKVQRHIIRSTLTQMLLQLDSERFMKVHRSYVVNTQKITAFTGNKSKASLQINGIESVIPVARSSYDSVKEISLKS